MSNYLSDMDISIASGQSTTSQMAAIIKERDELQVMVTETKREFGGGNFDENTYYRTNGGVSGSQGLDIP